MTETGERNLRFLLPPAIFLTLTVLAAIAAIFLPLPWIPRPLSDFVFAMGLVIGLGALWIVIAALQALRRANTTVLAGRPAQRLVTSGPFGFTRNPIYLGLATLLVGAGLALGQPWLLIAAVIAGVLINRLVIIEEEHMLESRFGRAWRDYRKKVRRWI